MATDPLAGSDLARVPLPDNVYGFGWAEIRYLLGRHGGESTAMTTRSLGFDVAAQRRGRRRSRCRLAARARPRRRRG